jgi:hypothetical protein
MTMSAPPRNCDQQPTLGNCSMASGAEQLGCLPRLYMMDPGGNRFLAQQYLSNNLFIYPSTRTTTSARTASAAMATSAGQHSRLLISQGSSGTDQPFLQALLSTTAAFRRTRRNC